MTLRSVIAIVAILAVTGCSETRFVGRPGLTLVQNAEFPSPSAADLVTSSRGYLLGPYDRIDINVFGVAELSRAAQIDPTGRITMPLIGEIEASGKSTAELAALIASRLRQNYVRDPRVSVNLTEAVSQVFTVEGAVAQAGQFPIIGRMSLMRAVAKANGTTEFAREDYVTVFRTVNGREMAALYDLRAIRAGMYADPEIYANDVISVGESQSRQVFKNLLQASGLLTAPLIAILN